MKCSDIKYNPSEWRIFIDLSMKSLKGILLYNGNTFTSNPMGYLVRLKENYKDLAMLLEEVNYREYQ